jgi:hypothetical protein
MSESDYLLAAIERCGARAKIAQGNLDRFTLMPSDASSERTYRKLKEDWREATEHAEHLRRRLGRFQWREDFASTANFTDLLLEETSGVS